METHKLSRERSSGTPTNQEEIVVSDSAVQAASRGASERSLAMPTTDDCRVLTDLFEALHPDFVSELYVHVMEQTHESLHHAHALHAPEDGHGHHSEGTADEHGMVVPQLFDHLTHATYVHVGLKLHDPAVAEELTRTIIATIWDPAAKPEELKRTAYVTTVDAVRERHCKFFRKVTVDFEKK